MKSWARLKPQTAQTVNEAVPMWSSKPPSLNESRLQALLSDEHYHSTHKTTQEKSDIISASRWPDHCPQAC